MKGQPVSKQTKDEIISIIKSEGITAAEAGRRYGINVKNIYRWFSQGLDGARSEVFEINRLKRENRELKWLS